MPCCLFSTFCSLQSTVLQKSRQGQSVKLRAGQLVNWSASDTRRRHASEHTLVCPYDDGVSPQPLPAQVFHCHSEGVQVDAAHHRMAAGTGCKATEKLRESV